MRQRLIIKSVKSALVNCPPTRLQQLTPEAFDGVSTKELERLQDKLETLIQVIRNNRQIRINRHNALLNAAGLDVLDKEYLIIELHKGNSNASIR